MVNGKTNTTLIITIFIGLIIGIVFLASISDSIFTQTNTVTLANSTITSPAISTATSIEGRDLIGSGVVYNGSFLVPATNVTISDGLISGIKTVIITVNNASFASTPLNVSYTYNPDGYLNTGGARNLALVIIIISALAILVFVIVMLVKGDFGKLFGDK